MSVTPLSIYRGRILIPSLNYEISHRLMILDGKVMT
jgi:hypothetical protein